MAEEVIDVSKKPKTERKHLTGFSSDVVRISDNLIEKENRYASGISELDRLLSGGLVDGQIVLLAGPPGIGKSTLMLQAANGLSKDKKILYVSGEESVSQVGSRAKRLKVKSDNIFLVSETNLDNVIEICRKQKPKVLIIDSIQTLYHPEFTGSPGTVGQVRESAAELLRFCKPEGIILFILGHVTKEGELAGPKVLEHIVDTVLYFDTEKDCLLRMLRVYKNRFGSTSELGIFQMQENGLESMDDVGLFFSDSTKDKHVKGRAFSIALEGTRPILSEIQALVTSTRYPFPRRMVTGMDLNRCQILFAAMEKHLGINLENKDVFVSLAGGLKLKDPALDLAVCAAVLSSAKDMELPNDWIFIGEVGILGQLARVPFLQGRVKEAKRLGFKKALTPMSVKKDDFKLSDFETAFLRDIADLLGEIKKTVSKI
jgi:DNA repair protein RadA/Sms